MTPKIIYTKHIENSTEILQNIFYVRIFLKLGARFDIRKGIHGPGCSEHEIFHNLMRMSLKNKIIVGKSIF